MPKTDFLDLDSVVPEREVVVKLDGAEHKMVPLTVEDFVRNTKTMEQLGTGKLDIETEKNLMVEMIHQAVPSVAIERLNKLTLTQVNRLLEFIRENRDDKKVEKEVAADASANPPAAG